MRPRSAFFCLTLPLLVCARQPSERPDIYAHPEAFVNRTAQVCGFMIDSSNILESNDRDDRARRGGLSIAEAGPLRLPRRGRVCVEGEIVYFGCQTGPVICTDAAFDYGIRIRRVIEPLAAGRQDAQLANSASEPAASGQACVRTFDQISLRGQVRFEITFGPPGFGENPARDQRRTVPILVLDRPIDICPATTDEIDDTSISQVRRVQLIYSRSSPRRAPGRTFVTGELQRATNAFHATPVTLIVDAQR